MFSLTARFRAAARLIPCILPG